METATIIEVVSLFIGTGGLAGFIVAMATIRWQRSRAKSEAHGAKYDGMKVEQDTYQELIDDLNADRKRMKEDAAEREAYINEIKRDRRELRKERDEMRVIIDDMREEQHKQADKIAYLTRIVESWKPLVCVKVDCQTRERNIMGLVSDDSFDVKDEKGGES